MSGEADTNGRVGEIAYALGREARIDGLPRTACPFAHPALSSRWLEGWRHIDEAVRMLAATN